jgi:hypothetical protein
VSHQPVSAARNGRHDCGTLRAVWVLTWTLEDMHLGAAGSWCSGVSARCFTKPGVGSRNVFWMKLGLSALIASA